jgi:oligopeptidase B
MKIFGQVTTEYLPIHSASTNVIGNPILKRKTGVSYDVEHNGGWFYFKSNHEKFINYVVWRANATILEGANDWASVAEVVVPHDDTVLIENIEMLQEYLVIWYRIGSLRKFRAVNVKSLKDTTSIDHIFQTSVYSVNRVFTNFEETTVRRRFDSACFIFTNSSFLYPTSIYSLNLKSLQVSSLIITRSTLVNPALYSEALLWLPAVDPALSIPLTIVYRTDMKHMQGNPVMMVAYGAYGGFSDPAFSEEIFRFLNRGYIWAVCHPRGDGDMGSSWYIDGKYELKKNTFSDVKQCIIGLISHGLARKDSIAFKGRSAGGLVASNAMTWMEKEATLLKAVVAHGKYLVIIVPFNDVLYDMHDRKVPWTAFEWYEWGNPNDNLIVKAMEGYSPYLNIKNQKIPASYISGGLLDSRVPFWEPLKFIAKWRGVLTRNDAPLLLRLTDQGHFISSTSESAEWITFVLANIG